MHATGGFTSRIEALNAYCLLGVGIDLNATHHVMAGRSDLHGLKSDVDVCELLELMPHRRELGLDDVGRKPLRHIEENATMG